MMSRHCFGLPLDTVTVDAAQPVGPLELWRQGLGHGGINSLPLPEVVVAGARKLRPRLIRLFIQEFFRVYPGKGRFDWSRLDPYLDSFARTGAKVMAAICIKPKPLYPRIDQAEWRPRDVAEWQHVIAQMVRRYSVERPIVTHWEVGNETDIGEHGGCPYLITRPEDYAEYYEMTIAPILREFPQAKVGGPAVAGVFNEPLPGLIRYCRQKGRPLDFVTWHLYHSDPALHAFTVHHVRSLLDGFPAGRRPEMMMTEFNRRLGEAVSVQEQGQDSRRAAALGAILVALVNAKIDGSFHYHLWDQMCFHEDFEPVFSPAGLHGMVRHWNEVPHRLGLFSVAGEVRGQYFVYQMLSRLGEERLAARAGGDLSVLAGRGEREISAFLANYNLDDNSDRAAVVKFTGLRPGLKKWTVYRIDAQCRWDRAALELLPVETRPVSTTSEFESQIFLPQDSVALGRLEEA